MIRNRVGLFFSAIILLLATSCNRELQQIMKSNDMDAKYEMAREYYTKGDCYKAIPLFEEVITYYKGSKDLEDLYYGYAYCNYMQKQYITASYHFERFTQLYPRSSKLEDAVFMMAKCNHEQSPKYQLDQTPTLKAIQQYQRFTERFPESDRIPEANAAIDELRAKLQRKAYENAMLYYKLKEYQAASTSFATLVKDYPASKDVERCYFYIVMSNKLLADNSYEVKKMERYEETLSSYETFKEKFPESPYLSDLEKVYQNTQAEIKTLEEKSSQNKSHHERGS